MDLFSEVKKLADANGDGKLSTDDIAALREKYPEQSGMLDKAKELADQNNDGKVDLRDLQNLNLGDIAGHIGSMLGK